MITTPFAIGGPLTGCTVPPLIAYTPGASASAGHAAAKRRKTTEKQRKRLDIRTPPRRDIISDGCGELGVGSRSWNLFATSDGVARCLCSHTPLPTPPDPRTTFD